jgi:transposase
LRQEDVTVAKRIDPAVRERGVRLVLEHQQEYASQMAAIEAVAKQVGMSRETLRRWVRRAEVDAGARPGVTTAELSELERLKAENRRLREDNEILKAASVFFAGELDPRNR